ncbi:MAG TPA: GTP 3',8-cyclase MoaA, partial [Lachnospiraceae bacterium]|nr:GTP 3',8-cyclase MoaA [Lachnospiraceae bacterium]
MIDQNGRSIDYVRISITDRCNLRCIYCMPEEGVCRIEHAQILRFEEIIRVVRILTEVGVKHVRLTGGEPMVRRGCLELAARLHAIPGVESISMTSNGILLNDRVHQAKLAGISSLNISMDALDPAVYSRVTRGGDVSLVLRVLEQALEEGLNVKVNTVPVRGINEDDLPGIAALAREAPLCVRFIELMPVGYGMQAERIPYAAER